MFLRKQGHQVTNLREVTNFGVEKIKLSRLLVQHIKKFIMNEIQCKTPKQNLKPS